MVEPQRLATKSFAHSFCSGVPSSQRTWAKDGPEEYIHTGAFEPRTSSARAHQKTRGAGVPSSSAGRSSRQNSLSMNAWYERLKLARTVTWCVAGSKAGGFRSPSA